MEIHHTLALAFIKEIRDKPNNVNNAVFSKVMLLLKFSNDKEELRDLVEKLDDLRDVSTVFACIQIYKLQFLTFLY